MSKGKQATLFQSWGHKKKDNVVNKEATKTLPKRDQTKYEVFIDLCEEFDDNSDDALAQAMDTTLQDGGDGDNQTSLPVCPSTSWSGYSSVKELQDVDEHNISLGAESFSDTPGLSQMSAPEGFDKTAGKLWIYPTNYPVRNYQHSIVQQGLLKNTLVTLPTGLGKTFIASVVMYNFYRWYPQGKVVFMAPTKPLVAQQIEACYNIMGIPQTDTAEMTGTMPPTERKRAWHVRRVFFLTPQVLTNDLSRGTCPADNIKCLVIDEAHKAQGNHAYCQVVRELVKYTREFRVLALSATPGTDIKSVQQVLVNLLISHIELRTEDSVDIKQYSHERKVEKIVVPLGEELNMVKKKYIQIMDVVVSRLKRQGVIYNRDTTSLSKFLILKAREGFRQNPPQRMPQSQYGVVEGDFALAMSLFHGFELLQLHGLRSLYNFLEGIVNGDKGYGRTRTELTRNADFNDVMGMLQEKFDPGASQCTQGGSKKPFVTGHPKMQKLQSVVLDHFDTFCKDNSVEKKEDIPTRIMIFSQYRDSVNEITDMLKQHWPVVKAMSFIGQSSTGKSSRGLTQKEQLLVMKKFREGGFNTLVSTCVGEEGLDIGEVDLIICFDAHKSPIRLVQRMGRTGRKRQGRIIMLVTEGKEEQIYNQSQYSKTSIHKAIKNGAKSLQFYKSNPRMVPDGWMPSCHKMYISVNQAYKPNKPIVEKGNQDIKSTKVKTTTSKDRDEEDDTILTELEYEELKTKIVPTSEIKVLPSSKFLSLGAEEEYEEETSVKQLSLNEWMPWQNRLHPEQFIDHSNRTKDFVEIVQFIELQQALDPQEDSYGAEMRLYLNEEDIFKTGNANQDGSTGIRKFCVSKENKAQVTKSKHEEQGTTNRGKKVRRSETLPNFDESEDEVDGDHDLPVMNFNQKDKSCHSTAATDTSILLNPDMEQEMERNRIKRKSTVGNRKSIMTRDSIGKVINVKSTRSSRDFGSLCNDTSRTSRRKSKIKKTSKLIQDIAETNENDFCEENEETPLQISDSITRSEDSSENIEKCVPVYSEKTEGLTSVSAVNEGQSMDTDHLKAEVEMETKNDIDDEAVSVYSHLLSRLGVVSCPVTQEKSSTSPDEERSCIKTPPPIEEIEEIVNSLSDKLPPIDLLELTEKWDREKLPETPSSKAWKRHSIEEDSPSTSKHMKDRRIKISVPEQDVKVCRNEKIISLELEETNSVQNRLKAKRSDESSVSDNEFDTDVKAQSTSSVEVTNSKLGKSDIGENMDNSLSAVNVSELDSANITNAGGNNSESANTKLSDSDDEKLATEHEHYVSDIHQPDNAEEDLDINEELQTQVNFGLDLDFQDNEDMDENDEIINLSPKPVFEQSVNASLFEDTFCDKDSLRHQEPVACNKDSEMESQFTFTQALACIHDSEGTQEMDIIQGNAKDTKIVTVRNATKNDRVLINKKSDTSQEVMDVPDACASDTDSRDFLVCDKTNKETPRSHDAQEAEMMEDEDIEFPQFDLGFDIDEDIIPPSPCTSQSFSQKSFSKCISQNLMMKSKRSLGLTSVQEITDKMKSGEMEKHQSTVVEEEDEEDLNVELASCMKSNSENGVPDIQRTPLQNEDNDSLLNCSDDDSYTLDRAPTESERHSPSPLIRGTHVDITATEKLHPFDGNPQKSSSPSIKHSAKQPGEPCSSESDLDDIFIVTKKKKKAPIIISPSTQESKRDKDFSSSSISDDSFEVKRKKKRNVLFSPPHTNMVGDVKTPVGSVLSKRSKENMRQASSSSDEANKQRNSKFMVSFNLPDIISDDDDFENDLSKIKKQYKDTLKEQHKARGGKEAARVHSRKTKNTRSSLNAFIEDEAEVSEDEEVSSDDERGDLDHYEDSFIGDATQMSQGTREDMQVMYMKSVKSPLNHAGRFKLKYGNYDMDVFSQLPPEEESQYMEDSFCVGSDYEDTCVDKLEDDSCLDEVTRLDLSDVSSIGRRTRWSKPVKKTNKVKKDQSSKRRRIKTMADSSSEDESNRLESTSRLASVGEEIHDLGVEKKRRKIFSSSASIEDDIRNMKMCKTSPDMSSDDSRFLKKSAVQEKTDVIGNLCDTESRFAKNCKIKLTPDRTKISSDIIDTENCSKSVVTVGEGIDSEKEKRLQRQREKQAEFKRKLAEKQQMDKSAISVAKGNVQYNSTNDRDATGNGDDSEDFLLNYSKTDPSVDEKPVILVDSREINGSQDIISFLRFQHDVKVVAAQLQGCDYIVSNRMGIDRKQWCEFSNGSNRDKLTERVHMLCKLYDRPCLIIEKDRVKEGEKDSNRPVHWTKYVDKTLVNLIMCKVSLYFTENQKETATMLADLCKLEQRKHFSISVPCDLTAEKQNQLKFYLSIPYVTQVIGLNLCHNFKSISEFVNSGLIGIRKKGCVSQERASQIHSYLRRMFDSQLLPTSNK